MNAVDWVVIAVFLLGVAGLGIWASRRASGSMDNFFVAGRSLPWWLAGTSMLATSFSSDTPLHASRMIRETGLSGAWFYWGGILSGVLVAFFFARLWRRTGVITDAQFIELRYSGRSAAGFRGALAVFRGLLETLTLAWVTLGMTKIVRVVIDLPDTVELFGWNVSADALVVGVLLVVAMAYTLTSGLWGVVVTDFVEFGVAMIGAIILCVIAYAKVGGPTGLRDGLEAQGRTAALDFFPRMDGEALPVVAIVVFLCVQWWATPYIDGSGQRAQRFLACKDESHALLAGVWNMAVQWIIRTWPWYLAALASIVLYPVLSDHEQAYPRMIADLMPIGLRGLMVASFFAAFMSTFDSLLTLSGSYLSNDIYRRFIRKTATQEHYVRASRIILLCIALVAGGMALALPSVLGAFRFKMEVMAGLGLVSALRWFWWRINALTEIITLFVSVTAAVGLTFVPELIATLAPDSGLLSVLGPFAGDTAAASAMRLLAVVGISSVATFVTAYTTRPEPRERLVAFYEMVRPPPLLWGPISAAAAPGEKGPITAATFAQFGVCVGFIFSAMFGLGKLILGEPVLGLGLIALSAALFYVLWLQILRGASRTAGSSSAQPAP
jgi:SSS family solute:Na+ symporter